MTTLTADQQKALDTIGEHIKKSQTERTAHLLEGGAGTGKTFLLGQILGNRPGGMVVVAAPTHKACNVLRRKLEAFGATWVRGYDPYSYDGRAIVTGTTAQLLGVGPLVADDQKDDEQKFGKTGTGGMLAKATPALLCIDEVSMLGRHDFMSLVEHGKRTGMKIVAIGDAGQLPPVKQEGIPFGKFKSSSTLRQVVRQAEGSAIIEVAWAIREGRPWRGINGTGVERVQHLLPDFLDVVQAPGERAEEDREVFIAYTNKRVNEAQEAACQRVYGHGAREFAAGEMVLSEVGFYRGRVLMCANQDELVVERFLDDEVDETLGVPVVLRHRRGGTHLEGSFRSYYLSPEQMADKQHPYNVELHRLRTLAVETQAKYNAAGKNSPARAAIDSQRKQAWVNFFSWRDQTVISFRHPFSITSHKSQGSTYRMVFADTADLGRFSPQAMYVAVTRPRESLIVAQ